LPQFDAVLRQPSGDASEGDRGVWVDNPTPEKMEYARRKMEAGIAKIVADFEAGRLR
jgi:hypothetical protein